MIVPNHVLLFHSEKNLKYLPEQVIEEILRNKMVRYMGVEVLSPFDYDMFYCESNTKIVQKVIDNTLHLQKEFNLKTHKSFTTTSFFWDYVSCSSDVKYLKRRLKSMRLEGFYLFIVTARE